MKKISDTNCCGKAVKLLVNTQYLEDKIRESGKKKGYLADKIGCSRSYLFKKINNKADFSSKEISVLCKEIGVSTLTEKEHIFFAK